MQFFVMLICLSEICVLFINHQKKFKALKVAMPKVVKSWNYCEI